MAALRFDFHAETDDDETDDDETDDDETDHAPETPPWRGTGHPFPFAMCAIEDEFIPQGVLLMGLGDILHELLLLVMTGMYIVWLLLLVCRLV